MTQPYLPPKRRFGQHFLEVTWVNKVLAAIKPKATDLILEIGPGRGALTFPLATQVQKILTIEIDRVLAKALRLSAGDTIETIQADVLEVDLKSITTRLRGKNGLIRVVGNLPYNISAPILLRLLREGHSHNIFDATIMVQREVGERVTALPGSKQYGPLAVMTELHSSSKRLLSLPPGAFRPQPKVHSMLIQLRFQLPERVPSSLGQFESFIRQLFSQRRKMIHNALAAVTLPRPIDAQACCRESKIDPSVRPAELKLGELLELYEVAARS